MDEREAAAFDEFRTQAAGKNRLMLAKEEREAKFEELRREKARREEEERLAEIERKWRAPFIQARRNGDLIVNWQGLTEVHADVYTLGPTLQTVRLIGNPFRKLPDSLFETFTKVVALNLSNCELDAIPDTLTEMPCLQDLNLIRNRLTVLQESFGNLRNLTGLHLASNQLTTLPKSISNLQVLPRLNLEQNPITHFPETVTRMRCKILSWSKLSLCQLPRKISAMALHLVSLSADHNQLRRIPREIGMLCNLKHLSLCDNQIRHIPDELCNCVSLERLWLDWNQISELPGDFLQLAKLESLHLEGNPMRMPEMRVIVKGMPTLRSWFEANVKFYEDKERKAVILELQSIFAAMHERGMHKLEFYEPGFSTEAIGERHDLYHAFVPAYLFDYVIPTWNEYVESFAEDQEAADRELSRFANRAREAEAKDIADDKLLEDAALEELQNILAGEANGGHGEGSDGPDAAAPTADEDANASKPGEDANEENPGSGADEAESERELVEPGVVTKTAAVPPKETQRAKILEELQKLEKDRVRQDHRTCAARAAHEMAKVPRKLEPFTFTPDEVQDAFDNYRDSYGLVVAYNEPAQFQRCGCRRNGEPRVCVPPNPEMWCERSATFLKVRLVTFMEKLRRDSRNLEEETLEERLQEIDAECGSFASSIGGSAFFQSLAREQATLLLEQERQERFVIRARLRLERTRQQHETKRARQRARLVDARNKRILKLEQKKRRAMAVLEAKRGWEARDWQAKVADLDDELKNHPQDVELEIIESEKEKSEERLRGQGRRHLIMQRYKPRREVVAWFHEWRTRAIARRTQHLRPKLILAHLAAERRRATIDIRREYRLTRRVMLNWLFMNVRMTFASWKEWTQYSVFWKTRLAREEESQRELQAASEEVERLYRRAERDKWVHAVDIFSDKDYWQHCETGEIVWDEPREEDCVYIPRVERLIPTGWKL